jgi:hypothetical protein
MWQVMAYHELSRQCPLYPLNHWAPCPSHRSSNDALFPPDWLFLGTQVNLQSLQAAHVAIQQVVALTGRIPTSLRFIVTLSREFTYAALVQATAWRMVFWRLASPPDLAAAAGV